MTNPESHEADESVRIALTLECQPNLERAKSREEKFKAMELATANARKRLEDWLREQQEGDSVISPPVDVKFLIPVFVVTTDNKTAAKLLDPELRPDFVKSAESPPPKLSIPPD